MNIDAYMAPIVVFAMLSELTFALITGRRLLNVNDTLGNLGVGLLQRVFHALVDTFFMGIYVVLYEVVAPFHIPATSVVGFILLFFGLDFSAFIYHWFSHRVNFAWAAHSVHHQSEELNLTVGFRVSLTSTPIHWMFLLTFALFGFHPVLFFLTYTTTTAYEVWYHTQAIGRLGFLDYILVTPSNHRVHHGCNPRYIDKNFGAMFIFWDRLFGTFQPEDEKSVFGITKQLKSFNPVCALATPFVRLARLSAETEGLWNKILVWVRPPEWRPPNFVENEDIWSRQKYSVATPRTITLYVISNYLLMIPATLALVHFRETLAVWDYAAGGLCVAASFASLTGLLELRPWAAWLEPIRLLVSAAFLLHVAPMSNAIALIVAVAILLSLFSVALVRRTRLQPIAA